MTTSSLTGVEGRDQFLQLLVTQLRNQDPLDPVKQEDFLSQLAQFSTLEQVEGLNSTMERQISLQEDLLLSQQVSQAGSIIGKSVVYRNETGRTVEGVVDSVKLQDGGLRIRIGLDEVALSAVSEIRISQIANPQVASVDEPVEVADPTDIDAEIGDAGVASEVPPTKLAPERTPDFQKDVGVPRFSFNGLSDNER